MHRRVDHRSYPTQVCACRAMWPPLNNWKLPISRHKLLRCRYQRWHYLLLRDNLPIFSVALKKFANYQIIFNLQIICELLRINRFMDVRYFYPVQTFLYFTSTYVFQRFYSRYQFVYLISKDLRSSVIDNSWYSRQRLFACSFSFPVI